MSHKNSMVIAYFICNINYKNILCLQTNQRSSNTAAATLLFLGVIESYPTIVLPTLTVLLCVTLVLVGGPILTPSSNPALRGVNLEGVGGTTLYFGTKCKLLSKWQLTIEYETKN